MTREKWRELCKRTPKGNCGPSRMFHQSTFVGVRDGVLIWLPGVTYRKKLGPNIG